MEAPDHDIDTGPLPCLTRTQRGGGRISRQGAGGGWSAAETAVDQACRMLRLPTICTKFPELTWTAVREQVSYLGASMPGR